MGHLARMQTSPFYLCGISISHLVDCKCGQTLSFVFDMLLPTKIKISKIARQGGLYNLCSPARTILVNPLLLLNHFFSLKCEILQLLTKVHSFILFKVTGNLSVATATCLPETLSLCRNYLTTKWVPRALMRFSTTAKGKLKRLATRFLEQTIKVVGQEMTPRILTRSTGNPNGAILARRLAMARETRSTEMCMFTNLPEVSW